MIVADPSDHGLRERSAIRHSVHPGGIMDRWRALLGATVAFETQSNRKLFFAQAGREL